jgi:hypothetical protein
MQSLLHWQQLNAIQEVWNDQTTPLLVNFLNIMGKGAAYIYIIKKKGVKAPDKDTNGKKKKNTNTAASWTSRLHYGFHSSDLKGYNSYIKRLFGGIYYLMLNLGL